MFKLTSIMLKLSTLKSSKSSKGFTLIELLVVIGIIGTLGAVALVAINPAEAQRKARDTQRMSLKPMHLNCLLKIIILILFLAQAF